MNRVTKGAVSAAAAAVLLLGGAGSLAYWNDNVTVGGGDINSGELKLTDPDCDPGAGTENSVWTLDTGEDESGEVFVPGTDTLVPGDVITKTCDIIVTAVGNHLRAGVTAAPGDDSTGLFDGEEPLMTVGVTSVEVAALPAGPFAPLVDDEITEANNGETIRVIVGVTFSAAAEDVSTQDVDSTLDDITINATQAHAVDVP